MTFDDELFAALGEQYDFVPKPSVGGMGEVYQARHRLLGELRAIKVIRAGLSRDSDLQERFLREARIASRLDHPNLVRLYDFAVNENGLAWMILEWVHGLDLAKLLDRVGRLPLDEALSIAEQTLSALQHLHSRGIVHRDISSDNLMVSKSPDSSARVKLIDLGIAKGIESSLDLTATGHFVGKLRYAAPEMLNAKSGARALDARSDLYSFGVVFYELLTGVNPVEGETTSELIAGHLLHPPRSFETSDPEGRVPEGLRRIALKALAKGLEGRYQSAESLIAELVETRHAIEAERTASELRETVGLGTVVEVRPVLDPEVEKDRARLDRVLSESVGAEGGESTVAHRTVGSPQAKESWFERLRANFRRQNSRRSSVASSVIQVLQEHPKAALSAVFGILLAIVIVFSGVLAGRDSPVGGDTGDAMDVTLQAGERQSTLLESEPSVMSDAQLVKPEPNGSVPAVTRPRSFDIVLISNNAQLSGILLERFGQELPVVLGSDLSRVLAAGGRGLAIQLDGESQAISVEAYETTLPSCEAVASAAIVAVPSGRSRFSKSVRKTAPRCANAMALAGAALAAEVEPKVRALTSEMR